MENIWRCLRELAGYTSSQHQAPTIPSSQNPEQLISAHNDLLPSNLQTPTPKLENHQEQTIPITDALLQSSQQESAPKLDDRLDQHISTSNALIPSDPQESAPKLEDSAIRTFTYFPKLPLEVRRMIWTESLPGPRIFEMVRRRSRELDSYTLETAHAALFFILRACKESEEVVLRKYVKIEAQDWNLTSLQHSSTAIVLFDYGQDLLLFKNTTALAEFLFYAPDDDLDRIKRIGLDICSLNQSIYMFVANGRSSLLCKDLPQLKNLKKIMLFGPRTKPQFTTRGFSEWRDSGVPMSWNEFLEMRKKEEVEWERRRERIERLGLRDEISLAQVSEMRSQFEALIQEDEDDQLSYLLDVELEAGSYVEQAQHANENWREI